MQKLKPSTRPRINISKGLAGRFLLFYVFYVFLRVCLLLFMCFVYVFFNVFLRVVIFVMCLYVFCSIVNAKA